MIQDSQRGFTLLEMVVSIAIFAFVSVVLSQVFIVTLRTNTKTEILKDVKQNGVLALESMIRMIQNAQSITSTCSDPGTTVQSLVVVNPDGEVTTLTCSLDGNVTRIASTSAQGTAYLTSSNVTLGGTTCEGSSLEFTCFGASGLPSSVEISFQLAQTGVSSQAFEQSSEIFQTTTTVRNASQ